MTQKEFTKEIAKRANLTLTQANSAVKTYHELIMEVVANGEKIMFPGFCTYTSRVQKGGKRRIPGTEQEIFVKEKRVPVVKIGTKFKNAVL